MATPPQVAGSIHRSRKTGQWRGGTRALKDDPPQVRLVLVAHSLPLEAVEDHRLHSLQRGEGLDEITGITAVA